MSGRNRRGSAEAGSASEIRYVFPRRWLRMASTVENSVEIDRPTGDVFAFVDDYRNVTRYIVGMTEYKPTTSQTSGKGSKFRFVKKTTGLPDIKSEVEITERERDKKISFKSFSGFDNGGSYTFSPRGARTL